MGYWNMHRVMETLNGVEVPPISSGKTNAQTGDSEILPFSPYEFSLLLSVAHLQHDEDATHPESACICYCNAGNLIALSHIKRARFYKAKDFLVNSKLVTFTEKGKFPNALSPSEEREYTNVWKINWNELDTIAARKENGVHHVDEAVHQVDEAVHQVDEGVHHVDEGVYHVDTKITERENTKDTITINASRGGDGENKSVDNSDYTHQYHQYMVKVFDLGPEHHIKDHILRRVVKGKKKEDVLKVINEFKEEAPIRLAKGEFHILIGEVINAISDIGKQDTAQFTSEDVTSAFSEAQKAEVKKHDAIKQEIRESWDAAVHDLGLNELPPEEFNALRSEYARTMNSDYRLVESFLNLFNLDARYYHGKMCTTEEILSTTTLAERVQAIKDIFQQINR